MWNFCYLSQNWYRNLSLLKVNALSLAPALFALSYQTLSTYNYGSFLTTSKTVSLAQPSFLNSNLTITASN